MSWTIREFEANDTEPLVALWEACGLTRPWNDPRADIARKLREQPELLLVVEDDATQLPGDARLIGSVMGGYDGHRATAPDHRGRGIARALVAEVERRLEAIGCPKAQLMVRADNEQALGFYAAIGYEQNEVFVLGKRLIED